MKKNRIVLNGYLLLKIMENYCNDMKIICENKGYNIKITPNSFLVDFSNEFEINGIWVISDNSCSYIDLFDRDENISYVEEEYVKENGRRLNEKYCEVEFKESKIYIKINSLLKIEIDNKNTIEFIDFVNEIDFYSNDKDKHSYMLKTAKLFKQKNINRSGYWFENVYNLANSEVGVGDLKLDREEIELNEYIVENAKNNIFNIHAYGENMEAYEYHKKSLSKLNPSNIIFTSYKKLPTVVLENKTYEEEEKNYSRDVKYVLSNLYTNEDVFTEVVNIDAGFYSYIKKTNIIDQFYLDAITFTTVDEDVELEFTILRREFGNVAREDTYYNMSLENRDVNKYRGNDKYLYSGKNDELKTWRYDDLREYNDDGEEQVLFGIIFENNGKFIAKIKDIGIYLHNITPKMFLTILHLEEYSLVQDFEVEKDTNFLDYSIVSAVDKKYSEETDIYFYEDDDIPF